MASASETRAQVAHESERRGRLAPPGFGGGVLYLLSGIIIAAALGGAPTVGIVEGLRPALHGGGTPAVSPRAAEVKFISHHAFALIAGSVLAAIAIAALTLILLLLADAARLRRPEMWPAARPLVIAGGITFALVSLAHQVVSAIQTHDFAVGHGFSEHAVENALSKATVYQVVDSFALLGGIALAAGMITVVLNSMRTGLLPRWMGILGMFTAIVLILPIGGATFQIVPAFWMVMMGILLGGRWPGGDPPAWAAGEARPWPSQAPPRGARQPRGRTRDQAPAEKGADEGASRSGDGSGAPAEAPVPVRPASSGTPRKRRRKRGARR